MFTVRRNLLFVFRLAAMKHLLGKNKICKSIWLALYLSMFSNEIGHVPGSLNTTADVMTRWMRGYRESRSSSRRISRIHEIRGANLVPIVPTDEACWINLDTIKPVQILSMKSPTTVATNDYGLVRLYDKIWISNDGDAVKVKLLTVSQAEQTGHCGRKETALSFREVFIWKELGIDANDFVACRLFVSFYKALQNLFDYIRPPCTSLDEMKYFNSIISVFGITKMTIITC